MKTTPNTAVQNDLATRPAHTPGPWKVFPTTDKGYSAISSVKWFALAEVVTRIEGDKEDCPTGLANAHLIAAAPDMLAVLKAMIADEDFVDLCQGIGAEPEWLKAARLAIARAEGR